MTRRLFGAWVAMVIAGMTAAYPAEAAALSNGRVVARVCTAGATDGLIPMLFHGSYETLPVGLHGRGGIYRASA